MCISALFIHGFLPDSMLSVVLVPVIKDKCRKINDSDNYRPIALASVISKVIEKILLTRMSDLLITTCNQFGFKSKLGRPTNTCIGPICSQRNCGKPSKLEWFYVYGFS